MDIISGVITAGVAIVAIFLITTIAGQMAISLPAFNRSVAAEAPWAEAMDSTTTNAGTAFNIMGMLPLVLGASLAIGILIAAFAYGRR